MIYCYRWKVTPLLELGESKVVSKNSSSFAIFTFCVYKGFSEKYKGKYVIALFLLSFYTESSNPLEVSKRNFYTSCISDHVVFEPTQGVRAPIGVSVSCHIKFNLFKKIVGNFENVFLNVWLMLCLAKVNVKYKKLFKIN